MTFTQSALRDSGLPYTIARPSFITGPDRDESRPAERIAAVIANATAGVARMFGAARLAGSMRSMTVAELAEGLVRHAFDASSENEILGAEELRAR